MTDDIVVRLREFYPCCGLNCYGYDKRETDPDCIEAADEIERLRAALDGAYAERNVLVAVLARIYSSGIKRTAIPGWDAAWHGCVYIDLPTGQASWHYHDREAHLFATLPPYQGEWDGHSTADKYARIVAALSPPAKDDAP